MHRLLVLLSLFTLHLSLFSAPPQLLRATLVGDNQLAPGATLTVQSGSTLTLASGSTFTAPANLLAWAAVNKTGSSLADLAARPWSALTGTPTTLAGYGITDAYASPLTTAGDLLYGGTSGAPTRLAIGTAGQVLSVSSGGLPAWSTLSGTGTVTSITAGTGLTGGTITSTGTIGLDTSGVTAGSYGSASAVPVLTVDATGRITSASTASITAGGTGDVTGPSSSTSGRLAVFSDTTGKVNADSSTLTLSGASIAPPNNQALYISTAHPSFWGASSDSSLICTPTSGNGSTAITALAFGGDRVGFRAGMAGGSVSSPTTTPANTIISFMGGHVYQGGWSEGMAAMLAFYTAATPTSTSRPTYIMLGTTPVGSTTRVERVRISAQGNLLVGTTDESGLTGARGLSVASTTNSTSPTTGALIVSGGAGIAGRTSTGSLSISTTGTACDGLWSATATLDFGSIAAASQADLTITVTGASVGDSVSLGLPASPTAGLVFNAWVSAANTVTIRATNITAAAIDPASATYRATVMSF